MKNFLHEGVCPIRDIISRFGDKWSLLVFVTLKANGTMRFNEIQKSIGDISQRMLTVTLRSLEADGFVKRVIYPEVPPRVEYCLSDLGYDLTPWFDGLLVWVSENQQAIMEAREVYGKKRHTQYSTHIC